MVKPHNDAHPWHPWPDPPLEDPCGEALLKWVKISETISVFAEETRMELLKGRWRRYWGAL